MGWWRPSKENIFSGNAQTFDDTSDSALQQFDDGMIRMQCTLLSNCATALMTGGANCTQNINNQTHVC